MGKLKIRQPANRRPSLQNRGVLKAVLAAIKPGRESERKEREFIARVMEKLAKQVKSAKISLAGSFAKGTFLEGDRDVDIFVLFRHSMEKEAMEGIVRGAVENAFPGCFFQIAYAQHPYVRLFLEGRKIDVVPAYEAGHGRHFELRSAVDRSVLHTEYVLGKMSGRQKDEVRLLKKFLKSNGLYGAEIKIQGFSGYLCELLVMEYGSFTNALKSVARWKSRTFIDIENQLPQDAALEKFETPLVVIDPVDRERNVSAVVSAENYFTLIALARAFPRAKSRIPFFEKRRFTDAQLKNFAKERRIHCLGFASPKIVDDVLWGQVRRFYSSLSALMKKEGFEIIGHRMGRCGKEACVLVELLNEPIPENKIVSGPPLEFGKDCEKFSVQYGKGQVFMHEGRMAAMVKRSARTMEELMKKIRKLPPPSHLSSIKDAKLYKGAEPIKKCREILEQYAAQKLIAGR